MSNNRDILPLRRKVFRLNQTELQLRKNAVVLKNSEELGWPNLNVSLTAAHPNEEEIIHPAVRHLWVKLALNPVHARLIVNKSQEYSGIAQERISILAPGASFRLDRRSDTHMLHVFLRHEILAEVAGEMFDRDAREEEVVSGVGLEDSGIGSLLQSLRHALFEPAQHSALKIEYLSRALAVDVLSRYGSARTMRQQLEKSRKDDLTQGQMKRIADYIDNYLGSDISLKDLAINAGLSRTLFIRRFRASFHSSPHQYLTRMRVRRAQDLLEKSSIPLKEVALECGFSDQAHFTVTFKRITGVTPGAYRSQLA